MSRIKCSSLLVAVLLALCAGMTSCKDDDLASDDHYKIPDWLKGNAYEVMQKDGNHSIFLRAIDLSDYREIVAGKSILTVVAPTDDAFRQYLSDKGYSSIDDLDAADHAYLNRLVGYHLMYYAFDWDKMVNFRPNEGDAATEEQRNAYAGFYFKHRTHASDPVEDVVDVVGGGDPQPIKVYHYELYLPVLSNRLFETRGIDAAYNYNYFFPDTEWGTGTGAGTFNIANARVIGGAVVTDNGYLYNVDHVVEPLNTIYGEMAKNPNYSKFLSIYDNYKTYVAVADEVRNSLGYDAYLLSHSGVPNIAWEWPTQSWIQMGSLERYGYNVFAPTNTAIDEFFRNFWTAESGYSSLEDLDPLVLQYFVMQSFAPSSEASDIVFPEEIKRGEVMTYYGTPIDIDPDEVTDRKMCANGVLYGMDRMEMPAIFTSVVGPAFKESRFNWYLYALDGSKTMLGLASRNSEFVTLIPTNDQFAACEPAIQLGVKLNGYELQQYNEQEGVYYSMGSGSLKNITDVHVAQNVKELKTTGTQVIPTNAAYNYWYVRDGRITTNALFNQQLSLEYSGDPFVEFSPILNDGHAWANGASYTYDAPAIFEQAKGDGLSRLLAVGNDKNYKYYMFAQLLIKAGLVSNSSLSALLVSPGSRFIAFAPTNEAITKALAENAIPGQSKLVVKDGELTGSADQAALKEYLTRYFISEPMNTAKFTDYPYPGSACQGEFLTVGGHNLNIYDDGSKLSIGQPGETPVQVSSEFGYLPFAYSDGCLHFIDGIL